MDVLELLELLEAGIPFRELYRYLSHKHPHIDSNTLLKMADVAYTEYQLHKED